jgi:predicted SAM-dependent methyltransferase
MKKWVTIWRVPPPTNETLLVRIGASVFDAYLSPIRGWFAMLPGGGEEKISEPQLWFCDEKYERVHLRCNEPEPARQEPVRLRRSTKPRQMAFGFDDSVSQSELRRRAA